MSDELSVIERGAVSVAASALPLDAILKAAQDPGTDVAKVEKLIGLYERMQDRDARQQFDAAMVACQAEMPRVTKDGRVINHKTGQEQSRYATLERIDTVIRPIYERHGFAVSTSIESMESGKYWAKAIVRHRSGHSEPHKMPLALDQSGAKNDTQGMGSTMSYARRYLLCSIFNIITEGEDKDGQQDEPTISPAQALTLNTLVKDRGTSMEKFYARVTTMAGYEVKALEQIPARLYTPIVDGLTKAAAK